MLLKDFNWGCGFTELLLSLYMIPRSLVNGLSPSLVANVRWSCVSIDSAAVSEVVCVTVFLANVDRKTYFQQSVECAKRKRFSEKNQSQHSVIYTPTMEVPVKRLNVTKICEKLVSICSSHFIS